METNFNTTMTELHRQEQAQANNQRNSEKQCDRTLMTIGGVAVFFYFNLFNIRRLTTKNYRPCTKHSKKLQAILFIHLK